MPNVTNFDGLKLNIHFRFPCHTSMSWQSQPISGMLRISNVAYKAVNTHTHACLQKACSTCRMPSKTLHDIDFSIPSKGSAACIYHIYLQSFLHEPAASCALLRRLQWFARILPKADQKTSQQEKTPKSQKGDSEQDLTLI